MMELTALGLLLLGVLLAEPVSRSLARAHWTVRDPVGALLVWQAVGLAGGLSLLGAGVVYGLAPLGCASTCIRGPRSFHRHFFQAFASISEPAPRYIR